MSEFSPEQLRNWTRGRWAGAGCPLVVRRFVHDTRQLVPGDCFVALTTGRRDGHAFLSAAVEKGAGAALVREENPLLELPQLVVKNPLEALQEIARHARRNFTGRVIGVTGSVGKTSTKDMLHRILGEDAFATEGNLNNFLGVPLMLTRLEAGRHSAAVIEAGMSEPGELARAGWMIEPDVAVITNVQPAHLSGLGSLEAIAEEKSALARRVRADGWVVLPEKCLAYGAFRTLTGRLLAVSFATSDALSGGPVRERVTAEIVEVEAGWRIDLRGYPLVEGSFAFPFSTRGMAENAALAAVTALALGVSAFRIREVFQAWRPSASRGEIRLLDGRLFYIDCYNASPASLADAAWAFDRRTAGMGGRLFVLAGMNELGAKSARLHWEVGAQLPLRTGDRLVLFGGDSAALGEGAVSAGFSAAAVARAESVEAVRELIQEFAGPVFLKGSRAYALERALPEGGVKTMEGH